MFAILLLSCCAAVRFRAARRVLEKADGQRSKTRFRPG
jgi:hypothetical protein